ncbi:hypothetical protein OIE13_21985 [Streptosporangium sp. NBC_01810]|uniref:hypothetical protein n=1 Tax=Streptosporangium sp. NBC_01810 TaxID=2975951 RepID=UPI002DD7F50D|nr:hypothetical protein [Streptosporangium sp. NBC_01810]WSA23616.1 hypothetical protein OIE13_21985 [Streptosporangium sp. NBC_01810]
MPLKRRFARATVSCAFAAAAVLSLGAFSPVPPTSPDGSPASTVQPASPDGSPTSMIQRVDPPPRPTARALTADEIRRRGLDKYIDMSLQQETPPRIVDTNQGKFASGILSPARQFSNTSSNFTSGCWYLTTTYGAPGRNGAAYHTWCGNGAQVTYTSASCTGSTNLPSYMYEGCQNIQAYGVGWNVWDVTDGWRFCTSYNPYTGVCSSRAYPWQKNRYGANGQVWLLGWGG